MTDRGQSETVGNVLLIGVVVVVATTAAVGITFNYTGGGGAGGLGGEAQRADIQASATADNLTLSHNGGERLPGSDVLVVVSNGSTEKRFAVDAANLTGTDGSFDPGEIVTREHGLTGDSMDVLVSVEKEGQSRLLLDTTVGLPKIVAVTNSVSWSGAADFSETTRGNSRFIVTSGTSFGQFVGPDGLQLQNVDATEPQGTSVTIVVQSDPDDDGIYEDNSDPIEYDGSDSYNVSGLSAESQQFRLRVELTPSSGSSVSFDGATLTTGLSRITWESPGDWDGATSTERIVHDATGGRVDDSLQLGYSTTETGLLTYYPFDTSDGGVAPDASGNGHDAVSNGPSPDSGGIVGTDSYTFNGSEAFLEDSDAGAYLNGNSEVTISYWARWNESLPTNSGVLSGSQPDGTDRPFNVRYDSAGYIGPCSSCIKAGFAVDGAESVTETGSDVQTTNWQHVVVTWSSGEAPTVYLNGSESSSARNPQSGDISDVQTLLVGQGPKDTGGSDGWAGTIDELRIYDRQLSAAEATNLYETANSGSLTTGTKTFNTAIDPATLDVANITATRPAGTGIQITVESDPNGDGTFEETSDTIALDGSSRYDVTGLSSSSKTYRLRIDLSTTSATASPVVDSVSLDPP